MKKISKWVITTLFWTDGKTNDRERNSIFTIKKNKDLVNFLNVNGCDVSFIVYDFSPNKILENSIHIPFKLQEYKRSEKINIILKNTESDFFSVIDSDCFFHESEYEKILKLYNNLDTNCTYNFDWKRLNNTKYIDFENYNFNLTHDWVFAMGNGIVGGLGAFFIVPTSKLKEIGGFDETITTWGGEDGEVLDRLLKITNRVCIHDFAPYHLPHFIDIGSSLYFKSR